MLLEQASCSLLGQVAGRLVRPGDVPLADADLGGHLVHAPLGEFADEVLVGDDPLGEVIGNSLDESHSGQIRMPSPPPERSRSLPVIQAEASESR